MKIIKYFELNDHENTTFEKLMSCCSIVKLSTLKKVMKKKYRFNLKVYCVCSHYIIYGTKNWGHILPASKTIIHVIDECMKFQCVSLLHFHLVKYQPTSMLKLYLFIYDVSYFFAQLHSNHSSYLKSNFFKIWFNFTHGWKI